LERRANPMSNAILSYPAEFRATEDGDVRKITGRAAVFGELSLDLGGFRERILPGAFAKTLADGGTKKAYWNHNSDRVLGSTKAGTLTLEERADGLHFEIEPPTWAKDHVESIKRGDVDQMSFGFRTIKDRWAKGEDGKVTRDLVEVQLFEVSPVANPAYPQTDAHVRSLDTTRLQELIVQADHDLLDEDGREELRRAIDDLRARTESHHSTEPDLEHHSDEPDGQDEEPEADYSLVDERISDLARLIPGGKR
jgi:uncharacterized protein